MMTHIRICMAHMGVTHFTPRHRKPALGLILTPRKYRLNLLAMLFEQPHHDLTSITSIIILCFITIHHHPSCNRYQLMRLFTDAKQPPAALMRPNHHQHLLSVHAQQFHTFARPAGNESWLA